MQRILGLWFSARAVLLVELSVGSQIKLLNKAGQAQSRHSTPARVIKHGISCKKSMQCDC